MKKQFSKTHSTCKVTFQLPKDAAPEAQSILVVGDFNDWQPNKGITLKLDRNGFFKAEIELETGKEYQFRYLIDQARWENDWSADKYVPSPFQGIENSVVSLLNEENQIVKKASKPKTTSPAPKKTSKDDLKKIEGIGPKIAECLHTAGIDSFQTLSETPLETLKEILVQAGPRYKMHDPSTWATQAKLAQNGEWETLKTLQAELKGGKKA